MRAVYVLLFVAVVVAGGARLAYAPYHDQPAQSTQGSPVERARQQLTTAKTHAGFAAGAGTLSGVQQHTGHAVNCLVGRADRRYDQKWGDVCQGQGNGVLADLKAAGAAGAGALKIAEEATKVGVETLGATGLAAAQAGAKKLAGLLEDALKALK
ncbi:MAG: hypothetical protein QN183_10365 [Armatimonadota bacterium]|nr:hypothetical protein [Armatimonadota bacterium]MDR7486352.1 hypothetical protein [Armatimonadota bacterium]MDR7534229.1 hypothetical protein [Armatimonadota bacterium]MDR7536755.1 hypothetical protein [Armatimonadota bacterium]